MQNAGFSGRNGHPNHMGWKGITWCILMCPSNQLWGMHSDTTTSIQLCPKDGASFLKRIFSAREKAVWWWTWAYCDEALIKCIADLLNAKTNNFVLSFHLRWYSGILSVTLRGVRQFILIKCFTCSVVAHESRIKIHDDETHVDNYVPISWSHIDSVHSWPLSDATLHCFVSKFVWTNG